MAEYWYALRSKPRKEDVVWKQVSELGYEVFYPRMRVNPINPRSKKVRPYFPGYMFVKLDLSVVGTLYFNGCRIRQAWLRLEGSQRTCQKT